MHTYNVTESKFKKRADGKKTNKEDHKCCNHVQSSGVLEMTSVGKLSQQELELE